MPKRPSREEILAAGFIELDDWFQKTHQGGIIAPSRRERRAYLRRPPRKVSVWRDLWELLKEGMKPW